MAIHQKHATLDERLDNVEKIYSDSANQNGILRTGYGNLANDLAAFRKLQVPGVLEERLQNVERLIRQELSSAHEHLDVLAQSVEREAQSRLARGLDGAGLG